jgi:hypothetical protein
MLELWNQANWSSLASAALHAITPAATAQIVNRFMDPVHPCSRPSL